MPEEKKTCIFFDIICKSIQKQFEEQNRTAIGNLLMSERIVYHAAIHRASRGKKTKVIFCIAR
jgi:hypothetical protein